MYARVDAKIKMYSSPQVMTTHEVVIKMTVQVSKNWEFPQFSAKFHQRMKLSETILNVHPTKR